MADYPTIDLQSQLMGRGLNPNNPSATYTDFADRIARNFREQAQMEQTLAQAKESIKQSQLMTKQKTEAAVAGYNPELIGTMSKEQAKEAVKIAIKIKKIKIDDQVIEDWYNSLPPLVKSSDVDTFISTLVKTTGFALLAQTFRTTTKTEIDETGVPHMYNIAIRKLDGKQTDLYDPQSGLPVFPDIVEQADEVDKSAAAETLAKAEKQLAGQEARFETARQTRDIKNWATLAKEINISNAPAARAIGQAAVNNMRADRALTLLNRKTDLTPQQYDIIVTDLAAIFKGGVPDIISLSEQRYGTLKGSIADQVQYWLSKPITIDTPELRNLLREVTLDVKNVDNNIIKNYIDTVAAGYEKYVNDDPERFTRIVNAQFRNMNLPEVELPEIKNIANKPLGSKESKTTEITEIDIHALGKALNLKKKGE